MKESIYINDFALVNALGNNKSEIAENLFSGSQQGFAVVDDLLQSGPIHIAQISAELPDLSHYPAHFNSRNNQLALYAYKDIEKKLEHLKTIYPANRIAVILGTSTSGIAQGEEAIAKKELTGHMPKDYDYRMQEMSNVAEFISTVAELDGLNMCISTACSSSAKSFITASEMINCGLIDAAIVGGVDSICGMTVNGFNALGSTSAAICSPSSVNRDGINIGEAAALAIISKTPSELAFFGGGESSDAHHMSAPHPEGLGAISAMENALANSGIKASDIDYVNLHGTATPKNDEMEAIAVANVFPHNPPASSSKSLIGHTLGAAGATEIGFCALVLQYQKLAPHIWDGQQDPNIPVINLAKKAENNNKIKYCLSNSFAFGGNNVSLIIGSNGHA